jgi:uncharacterized membrane protein
MSSLSYPLIAAVLAWLALALAAAYIIFRRRLLAGPGPERAFVLAGTLLLGVAPLMWVIVRELSGSASFFGGWIHATAALLLFAAAFRIRRQRDSGELSTLNFTEKSAWLVLGALILVYGTFILRSWNADAEAFAGAFIQSVIVFIAVMIVGHAIIALFHAPISEVDASPDERDRQIALKSSRNSYYVLFIGFWSLPVMVLLQQSIAQILIGWFSLLMLTELTYYLSVIFYYRLGKA